MIEIRRAAMADASALAEVYLAAFRATYDFPLAHADDEVRAWISGHVIADLETWVATDADRVIALLALSGHMIEQLYVEPAYTGRGTGSRLLALARQRRPRGLELWTFQVNTGARRFYRRHGFVEVEWGDGSGNEEGQPDVRLTWKPAR